MVILHIQSSPPSVGSWYMKTKRRCWSSVCLQQIRSVSSAIGGILRGQHRFSSHIQLKVIYQSIKGNIHTHVHFRPFKMLQITFYLFYIGNNDLIIYQPFGRNHLILLLNMEIFILRRAMNATSKSKNSDQDMNKLRECRETKNIHWSAKYRTKKRIIPSTTAKVGSPAIKIIHPILEQHGSTLWCHQMTNFH